MLKAAHLRVEARSTAAVLSPTPAGTRCLYNQHTDYKAFPHGIAFTFEIVCIDLNLSYYFRTCLSENCPFTAQNQENTMLFILEFRRKKRKPAWHHSRHQSLKPACENVGMYQYLLFLTIREYFL